MKSKSPDSTSKVSVIHKIALTFLFLGTIVSALFYKAAAQETHGITVRHTVRQVFHTKDSSAQYGHNQHVVPPLKLYDTVTVSFIGDIMQHMPQIKAAATTTGYDYSNAFRFMQSRLKQADLTIANMELTLESKPYSGYPFFSAPAQIAHAAKESGIDIFLLANNHIADKGLRGLNNTFAVYGNMDIKTMGVYRNSQEEQEQNPMILFIKGIKFALLNFTYGTNGMPVPAPYVVSLQDSLEIKKVLARAKRHNPDFIIAMPHWGEEYLLSPRQNQKKWAQMLFREGVTAIIGGHPHVPEEGHIFEDRVVFYSLGNYISNQSVPPYTQAGMFVTLKFVKNLITQESRMITPEWEYTWCFRKGEYLQDYTVVPIEEFMQSDDFKSGDTTPEQKASFEKMKNVYNFILNKELIKIIPKDYHTHN